MFEFKIECVFGIQILQAPLSRHQAPCQRLPFDLLWAIGSGEEISCGFQTHTWDAAAGMVGYDCI